MASPTQWTWVWVNSRNWWWTGRPDVPWFMGSQRVGHDWATELNWTEYHLSFLLCQCHLFRAYRDVEMCLEGSGSPLVPLASSIASSWHATQGWPWEAAEGICEFVNAHWNGCWSNQSHHWDIRYLVSVNAHNDGTWWVWRPQDDLWFVVLEESRAPAPSYPPHVGAGSPAARWLWMTEPLTHSSLE